MIAELAYYQILGFSVIALLGIVTYTLFGLAAFTALMSKKGKKFIPFKWHSRFAYTALGLATIHAILVISTKI